MLNLTRLEQRDNPSNLIPGWAGGEQIAYGHFNDDPLLDLAVVDHSWVHENDPWLDNSTRALEGD